MRTGFIVFISLLLGSCSKDSPPPSPESRVAQVPAASVSPAVVPAGDAAEGHRQANRVGCTGCHGKQGEGSNELWDDPGKYIVRSANLTVKRELYDDGGVEQLLRHGKTHDSHAPLGMPIFMFQRLSDREVRDITAWLRALPAVENPGLKPSWISDAVKKQIADGTYAEDDYLPDNGVAALAEPPTEPLALGEHLAMSACTECHGRDLRGWGPDDPAPNLVVAKAYSAADFQRLMRTGITASGKDSKTGFMSAVARQRFAGLTDAEISALKTYLDARAP